MEFGMVEDTRRLEEIVEWVEEHKPGLLEENDFQQWLEFFKVFPISEEPELWEMFTQWVYGEMDQTIRNPLAHEAPEGMEFPTGIHFGRHARGSEVYVPPMWLRRNALIAGETSSGKTNTLTYWARQLAEQGVKVWIFDFRRDYTQLEGFLNVPWRRLKLNPLNLLDPPDVEKNAALFKRVFGHSQGLWDASQRFISKVLHDLYEGFGSFEDKGWPSLNHLKSLVAKVKAPRHSPIADYKERTLNRLGDILDWEGSIFSCSRGFPIGEMAEQNIVFDLDGLGDQTAALVTQCLMASIYEYWKARGLQYRLNNVLISDEAKHVFDIRLQRRIPDMRPYVDDIMAETRAFGIGVILADQQPSELTPAVQANTHLKLVMGLGSGVDIEQMSRSTGLTERQLRYAYRLKKGQTIAKVSGHPPFLVQVPRVI